MTEAKLMPEFEQHDKVEACDLAAVGLFALGLSFAVRELTDGFIPVAWAESKTREPAGGSAAQQLVDEGLWEPVEDGYRVHDFAVYNPTKAVLDRRRRERNKKRSQRTSRREGTSPGDVPGEGRGRPQAAGQNPHSKAESHPSLPLPGPTAPGNPRSGGIQGGAAQHPSTQRSSGVAENSDSTAASSTAALSAKGTGSRDFGSDWQEWLADYREVSGNRRVMGSAPARRAFVARRREGRSLGDLKLATRGNVWQWGSESAEPNPQWTRPETILRASKVEGYALVGEKLASGELRAQAGQPEHPASRRIRERIGQGRVAVAVQ